MVESVSVLMVKGVIPTRITQTPNSMFNLVTFNGDDEAETWSKDLVVANKRNKQRFTKFVEKLRPLGGTNLQGRSCHPRSNRGTPWFRCPPHTKERVCLRRLPT